MFFQNPTLQELLKFDGDIYECNFTNDVKFYFIMESPCNKIDYDFITFYIQGSVLYLFRLGLK